MILLSFEGRPAPHGCLGQVCSSLIPSLLEQALSHEKIKFSGVREDPQHKENKKDPYKSDNQNHVVHADGFGDTSRYLSGRRESKGEIPSSP